jgi:hypothetical protein
MCVCRATTLITVANKLIAAGDSATVSTYLWTNNPSDGYGGGAIKFDLDYLAVSAGYSTKTCDLWEELESYDLFWNRITSKRALLVGAQFASKVSNKCKKASMDGLNLENYPCLIFL